MDNGASLCRRFLNGDESAFREITDAYKDNLIFFINRYVHNISVSQELAEDTFVEFYIHKKRFNYSSSLKTYLFTIGRNKAVSYLRKSARNADNAYETAEDKADEKTLEDEFITKERSAALHRALDKLPEDYRTVLHLIYFENMSYDEAGMVMKKSNKQITNLAYRAKNSLREILGKESIFIENE